MGDRLDSLITYLSGVQRSDAASVTSVALKGSVGLLLVKKNARKGLVVFNKGPATLYLCCGRAVDLNAAVTFVVPSGSHFVFPMPVFAGNIYGLLDGKDGLVFVTEHS